MGLLSKPYTFTAGATIVAAEHNSNFDTLYNGVNGNLDDSNFSSSSPLGNTKIAQITTASKVTGAALTSLNTIPAGAGIIPSANIGGIDLTTSVSGVLPTANGGTNSSAAANAANGVAVLDASAHIATSAISGVLGAWASRNLTTVYQAATDGFAIGYNTSASVAVTMIGYTDSSNPPTTIRTGNTGNGKNPNYAGICMPVRKGDYYKVEIDGGDATTYFWIPLGS